MLSVPHVFGLMEGKDKEFRDFLGSATPLVFSPL